MVAADHQEEELWQQGVAALADLPWCRLPGAPGLPHEGRAGSGCGGRGVLEAAAGDAVGLSRAKLAM